MNRIRSGDAEIAYEALGDGPPLVLDPKEVETARERIKTRYNVVTEQNLDETPAKRLPSDQDKKS